MPLSNLRLKNHPKVYEPAEDSFFLAENIKPPPKGRVLDVGTGSGILALFAAETASYVLGVDVNPHAVNLAKENAEINGIKNAEFRVGDLFSCIKSDEVFDVIIFNPPYLPVKESDALGKAWSGGAKGMEVIRRFISSASKHLKKEGTIFLLASSLNDINEIKKLFSEEGLSCSIVARKRLFFEELMVLRCSFAVFNRLK